MRYKCGVSALIIFFMLNQFIGKLIGGKDQTNYSENIIAFVSSNIGDNWITSKAIN